MKIYTKTGDDGSTGLIAGWRVRKCDSRIECFGTVDELNAALGVAGVVAEGEMLQRLRRAQNELFFIGSHLAAPDKKAEAQLPRLRKTMVQQLEKEIDAAELGLPPLKNFILPGGTELAARLHLARTVCRRAERQVVALSTQVAVSPVIVVYLNRLSDWLFVQARLANCRAGVADIPWMK
jgi:cob(I)alamin adenosyltransferase